MDEFIAWDKEREVFIDKDTNFEKLSDLGYGTDGYIKKDWVYNRDEAYPTCGADFFFPKIDEEYLERFTFHKLIKKDTEGNKIYADSSIVEFKRYREAFKAVVKYEKENARYLLEEINSKEQYSFYDNVYDLKVIGNLQQHKHLLGEEQ